MRQKFMEHNLEKSIEKVCETEHNLPVATANDDSDVKRIRDWWGAIEDDA